jgi:elongator complex protein 3
MIKDAGFKIDYHIMQNLPGSNPEKDLWCVKEIVSNQNFQPDQVKIYPTIVNEYAELYDWYKDGRYESYSDETLANLIVKIKQLIPYYIRINRIVRDFPGESIISGNKITNLREYISKTMAENGIACKCIRCRESKHETVDRSDATLFVDSYDASDGKEFFINYASPDRSKLYAFCRLRLPSDKNAEHFLKDLKNAAIIREIHTVGKIVPINSKSSGEPQHIGFGSSLIKEAEAIAKKAGYDTMAVIAGVGVRKYFYTLGYSLGDTYVLKKL